MPSCAAAGRSRAHLQAAPLTLHALQLLLEVAQHQHALGRLLAERQQLLVLVLYALVQGLVLDLELLEVDDVQPVPQVLARRAAVLQPAQLAGRVQRLEPRQLHLLVELQAGGRRAS
jgi:hypothetical protein